LALPQSAWVSDHSLKSSVLRRQTSCFPESRSGA